MRTIKSLGHFSRISLDAEHQINFINKINRVGECWEWVGSIHSGGYGSFKLNYKLETAHRVSYEHFIGKIPDGLTIDHICRNKKCVNPRHLRPMTLSENILIGSNPAAINKRKTHCIRGHELSGNNLVMHFKKSDNKHYRNCRACVGLRSRWVNERKKLTRR